MGPGCARVSPETPEQAGDVAPSHNWTHWSWEQGAGSPRAPVPTAVPGWEAGGEKPQPLPSPLMPGLPKAVGGREPVPGVSRQPGWRAGMQSVTALPLITEHRCRAGSGTKGPLCGSNGAVHSSAEQSQGGSAGGGATTLTPRGPRLHGQESMGTPRPRPGGAGLPAELLAGLSGWDWVVALVGSSGRLRVTRVGAER